MANRKADVKTIERFLKKHGAKLITGAKKNAPEYRKCIIDTKRCENKKSSCS
ncbi:MAG: hypothetical protein V1874_15625 [Spirochaetota bacterium]